MDESLRKLEPSHSDARTEYFRESSNRNDVALISLVHLPVHGQEPCRRRSIFIAEEVVHVVTDHEQVVPSRHLNNLLMLIAVGLLGVGHSKSRLRAKMRHPMLLGVLTWSVAHLLVNGDLSSVLLFGLLGIWAVVEIVVINRAEPLRTSWQGGSIAGDVRLGLITLVVFAVIAAIHTWLGYPPFPM